MKKLVLAIAILSGTAGAAEKFDLVVYGGTAGGVATAVSAARHGLSVALLEPRDHLGGMVSGGLSRTDVGKKEVIGGMALEFYWRAGLHYDVAQYGQEVAWLIEPKVAEQIFREMAQRAGVRVLYRYRLREKNGVRKTGTRLTSIVMENGAEFEAKIFADCTYEGDLMAQAGVSYTWGREGSSEYGESLAGVREKTPFHQFQVDISPYDANGKLLPEISAGTPGPAGSADKKVQAYNFRIIVSPDPANQVPFPKPRNYDPTRYELMARLLAASARQLGRPPTLREVLLPGQIPNHKADWNNQGAFSTDYIGKNWEYPEADYRRREEIWQEHADYVAGYLYFLANDPRVPPELRKEVKAWGLAKDEFTDTNHWPHQLYVREARRMIGEYVMTQHDIQENLTKSDAIGMGSYNSDSHNIQRFVNQQGFVENEGDMQVAVQPYQIPYRMMTPKRGQADNLLVPVCFSATHVAYSTLRMEPQYMIIGHAGGVAAQMAIAGNRTVQEIDTAALTETLKKEGAVLVYAPSSHNTPLQIIRKMASDARQPAR